MLYNSHSLDGTIFTSRLEGVAVLAWLQELESVARIQPVSSCLSPAALTSK